MCIIRPSCCKGYCGHVFNVNDLPNGPVISFFICKRNCISKGLEKGQLCVGNNHRCKTNKQCCSKFCSKEKRGHVCKTNKSIIPKEHPGCIKDGNRCQVPSLCCSGQCASVATAKHGYFDCQECVGSRDGCRDDICMYNSDCCTRYCEKGYYKRYGVIASELQVRVTLLSLFLFFIIFFIIAF